MAKRPRGPQPNWRPKSDRQQAILDDILAMYERHEREDTLPRGGRGIFYDLRPRGIVSSGWIYRKPDSEHPVKAPNEIHPQDVQEVLVMARRAGLVPERWVADGRMPDAIREFYDTSVEATAETVANIVNDAASDYKLNPQRTQALHIEVLCEAADLQPRLARIANPYGVTVYSGSGFDGLKGKRQMAERVVRREKPTVVLHIGDRDTHGEHIYNAVGEDVVGWADGRGVVLDIGTVDFPKLREVIEEETQPPFVCFARLGLTPDQAEDLGVLDADGKAEVDAVPVAVMDGWITDAIEALQTDEARDEHLAEQTADRERLPEAIKEALDRS